jgi:inositol hexakisphosphate/diphosphoinositol-pentakisphosphate kinase
MKVKVTEKRYLDYFHSYAKNSKKDVKVKSKVALLRFLEVTREIVKDPEVGKNKELIKQLRQIKDVLERWEISGINRKLQMKPQKWLENEGGDESMMAIRG